MCGIVGYVGERDCTDVLLDSLSKLEYRGYDSAGIAVFENGEITVEKAKGELKNLREKVAEHKPMGHCGSLLALYSAKNSSFSSFPNLPSSSYASSIHIYASVRSG